MFYLFLILTLGIWFVLISRRIATWGDAAIVSLLFDAIGGVIYAFLWNVVSPGVSDAFWGVWVASAFILFCVI